MKAMLDLVADHKAGAGGGVVSVCCAHPLAIEAALIQAKASGAPFALVEATCNQVNQDGGYTGMTPADFRDLVSSIAGRVAFPQDRILLGGDHLGPNPWTRLPAEAAMRKAEVMVEAYVAAGFRKIHADCSMSCADDPVPLPERVIAERAARLIAAAEAAWARAGAEPPVYVIGTEVPVPGGATEDLPELQVTAPEAALTTIETHREIFRREGLEAAWPRVIALVVQPGVEFDHHGVVGYDRAKACALSRAIEAAPHMLYEAHSTDFQTPAALADLVRDHFAVLKVGPAVTFALREAFWALDAIEQEWIAEGERARLRETVLNRMRAAPGHWAKYYHSSGEQLAFDLQYALSDRIRYYWTDPEVSGACARLFETLERSPPPMALVSQHMPLAFAALRGDEAALTPTRLVLAHVGAVLDPYTAAVQPTKELLDA